VSEDKLVAVSQHVEVVEDEVARLALVAETVTGEVDVGPFIPRKAGSFDVQGALGEDDLVVRRAGADRQVLYPRHRGDG
jgi:hypothetical protein